MLKVSFKDYENSPAKRVRRKGDVTKVTLIGRLKIQINWNIIPEHIMDWMTFHTGVEVSVNMADSSFILKAQGRTTKAPIDVDNPVLAERIAESKAKIKLYNFMFRLTSMLMLHYKKLIYGNSSIDIHPKELYHPVEDSIDKDFIKYSQLLRNEDDHLEKLLRES